MLPASLYSQNERINCAAAERSAVKGFSRHFSQIQDGGLSHQWFKLCTALRLRSQDMKYPHPFYLNHLHTSTDLDKLNCICCVLGDNYLWFYIFMSSLLWMYGRMVAAFKHIQFALRQLSLPHVKKTFVTWSKHCWFQFSTWCVYCNRAQEVL